MNGKKWKEWEIIELIWGGEKDLYVIYFVLLYMV